MKKPAKHEDNDFDLYAASKIVGMTPKWIRAKMLAHPHIWWMHKRYGTTGTEHVSRAFVAAIWFATHVYPYIVWRICWEIGWRKGQVMTREEREGHWMMRWYRAMAEEGSDFRWRWFALGLFGK